MADSALPPLPIDDVLPRIVDALRTSANVVICAPPGAGKTTRVPPALLNSTLGIRGRVLVLQPRRMAARAAARRIAFEQDTPLGEGVGYQVRFDQRIGPRTRIALVTEGILLRMLHDDPLIESVGAVVFDEFHERNLSSDLALGMARRIQQTVRPQLRLIVMSATLEAAPVATFLGDCPVIHSEGRTFPVEIRFAGVSEKRLPDRNSTGALVANGVEQIIDRTGGDVLAFLPGVGEIRGAAAELDGFCRRRGLALFELFGDLPPERQDAVLAPCDRRKIVLATNVAETSLTIPGITAVVDSGLARQLRFDPSVGLDRLVLGPISKASADQRAGRAGRTAPGICLRLWDERSHIHRPAFNQPEIERVDLSATVLHLWSWGETDVFGFPWFESPSLPAVEVALALLVRLGAIDGRTVTDPGRVMSRLPVAPRIGRLLIEGHHRGCVRRAALAAALISERDPFLRSSGPVHGNNRSMRTAANAVSRSDILDRVVALEEFESAGGGDTSFGPVNPAAAAFVLRARDQLAAECRRELGGEKTIETTDPEAFLQSMLGAFPDRLTKRRDSSSGKGVMVGGRGVRLSPQCAVTGAELFLSIDVDAGQTEAVVRQASAVKRDWLPPERLRTVDEVFFHPTQKSVVGRRRTYWDDLVIEEVSVPVTPGEASAKILAEAAWRDWDRVFPADDAAVQGYLTRVRCLAGWMPELKLPTFDESQLKEMLMQLSMTCRSFEDLRKAPWLELLKGVLTWAQREAVEHEAPERISVPSGNRITLTYEAGRPPVLPVRIQEVFGLRETPRIAGGRVRVVLHLLAPNMRTQQITDDLESFWANGYPQVRKDLRARYPKHAWPEDPWSAEPTHRPKKRRS